MSQTLLDRRKAALAPSYRLFYDDPVEIVRGEGVWLWDEKGAKYLDCYNNVPSVGHCHPRVVEAISKQAAVLNTHTRYLHENAVRLGERLGEKLPDDLSACFLVCTGSEAVDLAVQIARTVSGHRGVIVNEWSYHGNTNLVHELSLSSYGVDKARPEWLGVVEPPNTYRGGFREGEDDLGAKYAAQVESEISHLGMSGSGTAAFLVDSTWDSNGFVNAPTDYLSRVVEAVHQAGGLVIADEVQAGYCRTGDTWWGFEDYGIVPDIVTLGKPMGGGHPVGAVITSPAIAAEFAARRSYFNTFGGNPVSAAAALAVLDVIDEEGLLESVTSVGRHLRAGLGEVAGRHDIVGNIQGKGLFWAIDLVTDRGTREPLASAVTNRLVTGLRNQGALFGVTGRYDNSVKIRPPLVFGKPDADRALEILDGGLARV